MSQGPHVGGDDAPVAVAQGGPLDGSVLGAADADRLEVVMADRSRHVYAVTGAWGRSASGVRGRVYAWRGRQSPAGPSPR